MFLALSLVLSRTQIGAMIRAGVDNDVMAACLEINIERLFFIVIGGLGSLQGAIFGTLNYGFVQTFGAVLAPQLASILIYALLAASLVIKPQGLFPAKG